MKNENYLITVSPSGSGTTRVLLEGQLIIRNAAEIREQLIAAIKNYENLELVLENVTRIDLSVLQLLVALKKSAANFSKKVSFRPELSGKMKAIVERSGFGGFLYNS